MIISVYGAGYVGLVSAACLAKLGHRVTCIDINEQRIALLNNGGCPIHENDLPELLKEQQTNGGLSFSSNLKSAIQQATIHIIATGTPGLADGSADLSQVFTVASQVANEIESDGILVTKSTVPVGTGDKLQLLVNQCLEARSSPLKLTLASNPEFLREGTAVYDFLRADRIVIGGEEKALRTLRLMYQPLMEQGIPLVEMSLRSAELTKYAANAMLACRISFMNQMSQLAEKLKANIDDIRVAIGLDPRIGSTFLLAGIGYGGSCFPKDVRALEQIAESVGVDPQFLKAIDAVNNQQKMWVVKQLNRHFSEKLGGLTIGLWGLSFKPGTDDLREASSLVVIRDLLAAGAQLLAFDPVAMSGVQQLFAEENALVFCASPESILEKRLDALVILTEWPEFKNFSLDTIARQLGQAPLIDGRNCFELSKVSEAKLATYYSVGRPAIVNSPYTPQNL